MSKKIENTVSAILKSPEMLFLVQRAIEPFIRECGDEGDLSLSLKLSVKDNYDLGLSTKTETSIDVDLALILNDADQTSETPVTDPGACCEGAETEHEEHTCCGGGCHDHKK